MRKPITTTVLCAAVAAISTTAVYAMSVPAPATTAGTVIKIAEGCGPGFWRGPGGHCPPFAVGRACPVGYHLGPEGHKCWPNDRARIQGTQIRCNCSSPSAPRWRAFRLPARSWRTDCGLQDARRCPDELNSSELHTPTTIDAHGLWAKRTQSCPGTPISGRTPGGRAAPDCAPGSVRATQGMAWLYGNGRIGAI